jgi:hypothetical protein
MYRAASDRTMAAGLEQDALTWFLTASGSKWSAAAEG